jgi:hypothetical protein
MAGTAEHGVTHHPALLSTDFDPNWIKSHASYWAAKDAHDKGLYTLKKQYYDYEKSACLAVVVNSSDCPG